MKKFIINFSLTFSPGELILAGDSMKILKYWAKKLKCLTWLANFRNTKESPYLNYFGHCFLYNVVIDLIS